MACAGKKWDGEEGLSLADFPCAPWEKPERPEEVNHPMGLKKVQPFALVHTIRASGPGHRSTWKSMRDRRTMRGCIVTAMMMNEKRVMIMSGWAERIFDVPVAGYVREMNDVECEINIYADAESDTPPPPEDWGSVDPEIFVVINLDTHNDLLPGGDPSVHESIVVTTDEGVNDLLAMVQKAHEKYFKMKEKAKHWKEMTQ